MKRILNFYIALVLLVSANTPFNGMEARVRTEHEKTLSEIDIKIRDHFFAEERIEYYADKSSFYTCELIDADAFIKSFCRAIRIAPNRVSTHGKFYGISCEIVQGKDLITASTKSIVIDNKHGYRLNKEITAPICSLAYTPAQCITAGHNDGSLTLINIHERKMEKATSITLPQCHIAPVTSILHSPSQHICLLGGGNMVSLIKSIQFPYIKDGQHEVTVNRVFLPQGNNEAGKPILADLVALAGPFIVIQTDDKKLIANGIYSTDAFNAIQYGTLPEGHKTFLARMIDTQKNKRPVIFSDEEIKILDSLCPSIKKVLYGK